MRPGCWCLYEGSRVADESVNQNEEMQSPADSEVQVVADQQEVGFQGDPIEMLKTGWRDAWQVPALLVGAGMLMFAIAFSISTSPRPDRAPAISRANSLIENEQYQEAIELLNTEVYPFIEEPDFTLDNRVNYHLAKARSIYRGQAKMQIEDDRNNVAIIREFLEAERLGGGLGPNDISSLANAYIARDEMKQALQRAREIPATQQFLRDAVNKRAVNSMLDRVVPETEKAMEVLADMLIDPKLPIADRVWALETQGNVRLSQGYADETITRILRAMPLLERAGADGRSRLHLILAKAYNQIGASKQANEQVEYARVLTTNGEPHYPEVLLIQGIVEDAQGHTQIARDMFSEVVTNYSSSSAYPMALLGLGETEAGLDQAVLSFEAYTDLVEQYDRFGIESFPSRKDVLESLLERANDSLSAGLPSDSIWYASLADKLYRGKDIPVGVLEALALGNQAQAQALLGQPIEEVKSLMGLEPSLRAEVQRHLMSAATNYQMHAERHVVSNLPVYAESLWRSADLFDRAGDQREAIQAFKTYSESMPSDPRFAEALFRLGESLRAMGDFKSAADVYNELIEARESSAGADIGPFADKSHVPLAQAYLYDEDEANDAEAEKLLVSSLDGSMGSSETGLFRDALLELAGLYDRTNRPARAIERYTEFASRYKNDPEAGTVLFKLADAHRQLGGVIEESLGQAMPAAERNRRKSEIASHLRDAIAHYESTIELLGAKKSTQLGLFESIALRNAHFYLGDCAFDLSEYKQAIQYYDRARDRYVSDPASLVAMVQIVNAYIALDEYGRAQTANERARRFYETIPSEVWDDPTLPMDRTDWENWLSSSATLLARVSQ